MTSGKRFTFALVPLLILIVTCNSVAQQNDPVYDSDIVVKSFEEMLYPPLAREARIQGTVVVSAKLDNAGRVSSTSAVSGPKLLIPDSLANAKKWRFKPNTNAVAIIIYEFQLAEGKCNHETSHLFVFHEPNRVSIVGCEQNWQP
jgi:TonB family protein